MSEPHNLYGPPRSELGRIAQTADGLVDAAIGKRFLNLILDYVGFGLCALVVAFVLVLTTHVVVDRTTGRVVAFGAMVAYYLFFEGLFGRTPGKLLTGTRVVTRDGGRPRFGQIVGRTFARFVPFEPFSFLAGTPTGWHDDWSGTRVIVVR